MSGCCKSGKELVQIAGSSISGGAKRADVAAEPVSGDVVSQGLISITRRGFLKGLGATSALTVAACAPDVSEKIYPNVKGEGEQIPGVAVWYSSTCTECAAGCGIQVRTREGRAVKIEGNPLHPINRGSLCGLGQASLQHLYDPDRVRQPLKRVSAPSEIKARFEPITWEEAYSTIKEGLAAAKNSKFILTGELGNGSLDTLVDKFSTDNGFEHITFDALSPTPFAKASEKVFGTYGVPNLDFSKADLVVNFGADFMETWISPCQFSKDWSIARKREVPVRVVHFEPRASLTAANADEWHSIAPGSELDLAKALLKAISASSKNASAPQIASALASFDSGKALKAAGIEEKVITGAAKALVASSGSLVISGGTLGLTAQAQELAEVCLLINSVLGNIGKTVDYSRVRTPQSSVDKLAAAIKVMSDRKADVVFLYETNPAFSLPSSFGYQYAARFVPLIVSFSSHLDETAQMATIVLPSHTSLEAWGDSVPYSGLHNVTQPVMAQIFDTKHFGEQLMSISAANAKKLVDDKIVSYYDYLRDQWKAVQSKSAANVDFEKFWRETVEKGGVFKAPDAKAAPTLSAGKIDEVLKSNSVAVFDSKGIEGDSLVLYPFVTVKSFDGRAANRPWLQELPDPVTKIVWDSWAEIHPVTAKKFNLANGDITTIRNFYGELNVPVFVTPYVDEGTIAVPLGNGHNAYGRYAEAVGGGNSFDLAPAVMIADGTAAALLGTRVSVTRAAGRSKVVVMQGSFDQLDRGLARTDFIDEAKGEHEEPGKPIGHAGVPNGTDTGDQHVEGAHGGGGEEEVEAEPYAHGAHGEKQFYKQREHPLYRWGMVVDLNACTGCSACIVACYAENNIPVVGKEGAYKDRTMAWLRIERYDDGGAEELQVNFLPMMCQHCGHAPCEPVCPVYATYHNEEGLNAMVYNRCVGTRYCGNNCSYKVRRFNFAEYDFPSPLDWQLNPDVTRRVVGVMEKCTFCVQRIVEAKDSAKDEGRKVRDGEVKPACVQGCPTEALTFGNWLDPESKLNQLVNANHARGYKILDGELNTQPAVTYLERRKYKKSVSNQA